jgi:hypothetical protein
MIEKSLSSLLLPVHLTNRSSAEEVWDFLPRRPLHFEDSEDYIDRNAASPPPLRNQAVEFELEKRNGNWLIRSIK